MVPTIKGIKGKFSDIPINTKSGIKKVLNANISHIKFFDFNIKEISFKKECSSVDKYSVLNFLLLIRK